MAKALSDKVAVFEDVEIYCDKPLPQYGAAANKAYKASSKAKGPNLYAVVCERHILPRRHSASVYFSCANLSLAPLISHGKVYWPPANSECYVFIYADVLGKPFLLPDAPLALGWKQDAVMERVVLPLVDALQTLRDRDFVHGGIRVDNMFQGSGAKGEQRIVLGDCLSAPPAYAQPALYETIERSMAVPAARGRGARSDDLYAFGVSLAIFMRSQDPLAGLSDAAVIRQKIVHGSYGAITGKDRFKGSILELLRGLLHDDPLQRWNVDEVLAWLDGQRPSPKQALKKKKAIRPFTLGEDKVFQTRVLAMSVAAQPDEALMVIEDDTLEQWLERSLEDIDALERVERAIEFSKKAGPQGDSHNDRLVANISSALDGMAPLRFRGRGMMGDGLGAVLCEDIALGRSVQNFVDMILHMVASYWVVMSENPYLDLSSLTGKFDNCRSFLRQGKIGYGVERCLYMLAPEAPCLSDKFKNYYVTSPEEMLLAFEGLCEKGEIGTGFFDRHSVAFLSEADSKLIDRYIYDLNTSEEHRKSLATLKCLTAIQKLSKNQSFPAVGQELFKRLSSVLNQYRDVELREQLEQRLKKFAEAGDLLKMERLLDDSELIKSDSIGFQRAMDEYTQLRSEYKNLEIRLQNEKTFGRAVGREFAALTSGGLAVLIMLFTAFMFFTDKSIF